MYKRNLTLSNAAYKEALTRTILAEPTEYGNRRPPNNLRQPEPYGTNNYVPTRPYVPKPRRGRR